MYEKIKDIIKTKPYDFLRTNSHLGKNIVLLGLGGSYAYGTNIDTSDIDIRGIAFNSKEEILLGKDFEQVVDVETDTTIYSLKKMVELLCNNNPNTLEILGLNLDQYIYANNDFISSLGDMKEAFLSKKVIRTFGGYANSQLRRMQNKAASKLGEAQREQHVINSIKFAEQDFKSHYARLPEDALRLYTDTSDKEDKESEIFIDVNVTHYPLRDFTGYMNEFHAVVRDYDKTNSKRNRYAVAKGKLSKHMMHLVRLYYMCFDILLYHKVITYRLNEHDLLMSIRNGDYLDDNDQPTKEFYALVDKLEDRLSELSKITTLPEEPQYEKINKWMCEVNEHIVRNS